MAALTFYSDESFDEQLYVVAGYLGETAVWEQVFTPKWSEIISCAPHPISEFKASDCQGRRGEFASWTREECDALTKQLVDLIIATCATGGCGGFATALVFPGIIDGSQASKAQRQAWRRNLEQVGYGRCLGLTYSDALDVGAQYVEARSAAAVEAGNPANEPCGADVQPIFDRKEGFTQRVLLNFQTVCDYLGPDRAKRLCTPLPGDSHQLAPLQAADLLAFETLKEVWNRCESRRVRTALNRLVTEGHHRAFCLLFPPLEQVRRHHQAGQQAPMSTARLYPLGGPVRAPGCWGVDAS